MSNIPELRARRPHRHPDDERPRGAATPLTGNTAVPEFLAAIDRIHADHSVRAVILTGAGTAFSSGGNVQATWAATATMPRDGAAPRVPPRHPEAAAGAVQPRGAGDRRGQRPRHRRRPATWPACATSASPPRRRSSPRASSSSASFPATAARGCCRASSACRARPSCPSPGRPIDAQQALEWNLVSRVVPRDQLMPTARELAERDRRQPAARRAPGQAPAARGPAHAARYAAGDVGRVPGAGAPDGRPPRGGGGLRREAASPISRTAQGRPATACVTGGGGGCLAVLWR